MDISNLTSVYTKAAVNGTRNAELEKMKADWKKNASGKTEDEKLMDACKQFESYFVEQMFKEMWKTVPKTEYSSNSMNTMSDYYQEQMIQEFAKMNTEQGGYGLAQKLYNQMKVNTEGKAVPRKDDSESVTEV